jgi:hypothetical protein
MLVIAVKGCKNLPPSVSAIIVKPPFNLPAIADANAWHAFLTLRL